MKNGGMTMNSVEMVKKFSDAFGPSGFEDDVIGVAKELIPQGYEYQIDTLNNLYFEKKLSSSGISVHFDAHADEVGFIVQAIAPNGLIRFLPLGGWDTRNIPSSKVLIKTQEGKYVKGIVCSKPPHFMSKNDKDKPLNFEDLFIDVGATNKVDVEKNYGIRIGDPVAPDVICEFDEDHDLFIGKAFDCRIGCAAVFDTIRDIDANKNISASLSSQEEVGERGMKALISKIKADVMICFEGCPADDTFSEEYMIQSAIKRGPMLRFFDVSMITHPKFMHFAQRVADKYNIPMQVSVRKGGGTNGGISHLSDIPTIIIGIPVRYAHSHHGFASYQDYKNAVFLASKIVEELDEDTLKGFKIK